jgi:RNA polymerase sigma-70 factor (ECF subfamily)
MSARSAMGDAASRPTTQREDAEAERLTAFRRLAERHLEPSYRLGNAILGNPAEAEDAVHDAFVVAWRKWDTLRDTTKFEPWFKRIVVNTCRDRLRRRARTATSDIAAHHSIGSPDPTGVVADRVQLEQALATLKPDDQVLIVLRYDHDLKLDDVAQLLGVPTGTIKRRLSTAHKRLRSALEQSEGGPR